MPPSSSEVSQLSEMSAELSSSKESNGRRRSEVADTAVKIGRLEKSLEEQVALADRHREDLAALSAALEKRVQKTQDLDLKLGHIARQTSEVHFPRLAAVSKAVEDHQGGVATQVPQDLEAGMDRLSLLEARNCECKRRNELAKNEATEDRARQDEAKELSNRAEELDEQVEAERRDRAASEASRVSSAQAIQRFRSERALVERRAEASEGSLEQSTRESAKLRARLEGAERSDREHEVLHNSQKRSISAEAEALEQNIAQLSVEDPRPAALEAEEAALAKTRQELAAEADDADRESKDDDAKVVRMKAQLQAKSQRRTLLVDQRAKDDEVFAAHAINEPEFGDRKAEHKALSSKTAAVRSTQASTGARKAGHEEEMRRLAKEYEDEKVAIAKDVAAEEEDHARVVSESKAAAAAAATKEISVAKKQAERASAEAVVEKMTATLAHLCGLEEELKSKMDKEDHDHEGVMARAQEMALRLQEEDAIIRRAITNLEDESAKKEADETADRQRRLEADKRKLFADTVAWRIQEKTKAIEDARAGEVSNYQQEITAADEKFRAAWAEAMSDQDPGSGGIEEHLREEARSIEAQMAVEKPEIDSTETRNQRLRESLQA